MITKNRTQDGSSDVTNFFDDGQFFRVHREFNSDIEIRSVFDLYYDAINGDLKMTYEFKSSIGESKLNCALHEEHPLETFRNAAFRAWCTGDIDLVMRHVDLIHNKIDQENAQILTNAIRKKAMSVPTLLNDAAFA